MPMLKPWAPDAVRRGRHRLLGQLGELRVSTPVSSVSATCRYGTVIRWPPLYGYRLSTAYTCSPRGRPARPRRTWRDRAEGAAVVGAGAARLVLALDDHPVGRPQALERVLGPHSQLLLQAHSSCVQHMASCAATGKPPGSPGAPGILGGSDLRPLLDDLRDLRDASSTGMPFPESRRGSGRRRRCSSCPRRPR